MVDILARFQAPSSILKQGHIPHIGLDRTELFQLLNQTLDPIDDSVNQRPNNLLGNTKLTSKAYIDVT